MSELKDRVDKAIKYYDNGDPIKDADINDYELVEYIIKSRAEVDQLIAEACEKQKKICVDSYINNGRDDPIGAILNAPAPEGE